MRAADFSWEAPPSPVRTTNQQHRYYCSSTASQTSLRSPKRVNACFNFARGCLPQSLHSPQFQSLTRFTLIYPSCSVFLFGNDRANCDIWTTRLAFPKNCALRSKKVCAQTDTSLTKLYTFGTTPTVQTNEYQSVYGSAFRSSSMSEAVL